MSDVPWFEIERCFVRRLHEKRHRVMLVRDHPPAGDVAKADSRSHPHVGLFAVRPRSANPIKTVAVGHVVRRDDAQLSDLIAHATLKCRKPGGPVMLAGIRPAVLERRRKVE